MKSHAIRQLSAAATFFLLSILCAAPAFAANFEICVGNDTDLKTALNQAQNISVTIKIARGTYDLKNTVWHDFATNLAVIRSGSQVLGGYSADCSSRIIAVGNTVIT